MLYFGQLHDLFAGGNVEHSQYIEFLSNYFHPFYLTTAVAGGHDWLHVRDVQRMGSSIQSYLDFDINEFNVAAIMHNMDRAVKLKGETESLGGLEQHIRQLLESSDFSPEACDRVVYAVLKHNQKDNLPGESNLAIALRDADKLVRFRPSNLLYAGAHGGSMGVPAFLSENPFGFTSTREKDRTSMWLGFMGNLEWVGMLSCDAARELIDPHYFRFFLEFLRLFGREITGHTRCLNKSEDDIKKALGDWYIWACNR